MPAVYPSDFLSSFCLAFPHTRNGDLADSFSIPLHQVRKIAKTMGLRKSPAFMKMTHQQALLAKKEKQEASRKTYQLTRLQQNILVGSLLGDGSLALYGRSRNAHYREHGCAAQDGYRRWKREMLDSLDFRFSNKGKTGKLSSPSHPIYTALYHQFYDARGRKMITPQNIRLLDHPIGLACLFMDDGTLVVNTSSKPTCSKVYLLPTISLYTLNFTEEENLILASHLQDTFNVRFRLKKRPDGKGCVLFLGKRNEIHHFLDIIRPYVEQISCMMYKVDLEARMLEKQGSHSHARPHKEILLSPLQLEDVSYSDMEVETIMEMRAAGRTVAEIASILGRSYWGIYDKIRRLRHSHQL